MKTIKGVLSFILAVSLLTACKNATFKKTKSGMPYKIIQGSGGDSLKEGGYFKAEILVKIDDSVLYSTYKLGATAVVPVRVRGSYDPSELFSKLRVGDSLYTVQMMDTIINKNNGNIDPRFKKGQRLITTFKILSFIKDENEAMAESQKSQEIMMAQQQKERVEALAKDPALAKEVGEISSYLADKKINATKTGLGTFVEIKEQGAGPQADSGKYVSVKYTGTTFEGQPFDSNVIDSFKHKEPLEFKVGDVGPNGMITGFDEGIRLLKKGGKARLYIPSMLGYGAMQRSEVLKPYTNLIFDIELLDVTDTLPKQPMPTMPEQHPK